MTCQHVLRAYLPVCLACLHVNVSCLHTCLRANMLSVGTCSSVDVPWVLTYLVSTDLAHLSTHVLRWLASSCAHVPICLESLA